MPQRVGNEHPNIVPYNVLPASDGFIILAVGNDAQYQKFCDFAGAPELAKDARFITNADRVRNRREIYELLPAVTPAEETGGVDRRAWPSSACPAAR